MDNKTFEYWIPRFLRYVEVERRGSIHTLQAYGRDLEHFAEYLKARDNSPSVLEHFSKSTIRGYLSGLMEQNYTPRSISRKLSAMRMFARYLVRENVRSDNPVLNITSPKLDKKLPAFMTAPETRALLELPDRNTPEGLRDFIILEMFYATGIRVSELVNLRIRDLDMFNGTLSVLGKRNKRRIIPLGDQLESDLENYIRNWPAITGAKPEFNDYIFVTEKKVPFTRHQIARIVQGYILKVADARKAHPHALRHTFATHLLDAGADLMSVKELLGHSNLGTTQIYTHISAEHLRRAYQNAHPRAKNK